MISLFRLAIMSVVFFISVTSAGVVWCIVFSMRIIVWRLVLCMCIGLLHEIGMLKMSVWILPNCCIQSVWLVYCVCRSVVLSCVPNAKEVL